MVALLADAHADAHLEAITEVCRRPQWNGFWRHLQVGTHSFADFLLPPDIKDSSLWHFCQAKQLLLVTANRNHDGPESLEATIRNHSTVDSLPVLTMANGREILKNRAYAERAGIRLLEILSDIERYRGCGRLFLPAE